MSSSPRPPSTPPAPSKPPRHQRPPNIHERPMASDRQTSSPGSQSPLGSVRRIEPVARAHRALPRLVPVFARDERRTTRVASERRAPSRTAGYGTRARGPVGAAVTEAGQGSCGTTANRRRGCQCPAPAGPGGTRTRRQRRPFSPSVRAYASGVPRVAGAFSSMSLRCRSSR